MKTSVPRESWNWEYCAPLRLILRVIMPRDYIRQATKHWKLEDFEWIIRGHARTAKTRKRPYADRSASGLFIERIV